MAFFVKKIVLGANAIGVNAESVIRRSRDIHLTSARTCQRAGAPRQRAGRPLALFCRSGTTPFP